MTRRCKYKYRSQESLTTPGHPESRQDILAVDGLQSIKHAKHIVTYANNLVST